MVKILFACSDRKCKFRSYKKPESIVPPKLTKGDIGPKPSGSGKALVALFSQASASRSTYHTNILLVGGNNKQFFNTTTAMQTEEQKSNTRRMKAFANENAADTADDPTGIRQWKNGRKASNARHP